MTVPRDYRDFLGDMAEACGSIIQFVDGMMIDKYAAQNQRVGACTDETSVISDVQTAKKSRHFFAPCSSNLAEAAWSRPPFLRRRDPWRRLLDDMRHRE